MPGPRPRPLPAGIDAAHGFLAAEAVALGVTPSRLFNRDLARPTRGVRVNATTPVDLTARATLFARALPPDAAFSHTTAARLLNLPLPQPWSPVEPLDVMRVSGTSWLERLGTHSHRGLEHRQVVRYRGLRAVHPLDTWLDLATVLPRDDLVIIGDVLVNRRLGVSPVDLADLCASRTGRRGVVVLRAAAALIRAGSGSPWETRARLLFHRWSLPEPELNADVLSDGLWIARPDFLWRQARVVGEYDGDQHRTDRRRWQYERERRAALEADGWTYVEMTSLTLTRRDLRDRLRARLTTLLC